jgi:hypothetical protein
LDGVRDHEVLVILATAPISRVRHLRHVERDRRPGDERHAARQSSVPSTQGTEGSDVAAVALVDAASSAAFSAGGSSRPLREARRRTPAHAFGLKKYFGGIWSGGNKTSSNDEDTPPSLGNSEVLRVEDPPSPHVPEFSHAPEDCLPIFAFVDREEPRDVFEKEPRRLLFADEVEEAPDKAGAGISEPFAPSSGRIALAGESSTPDVGVWDVGGPDFVNVSSFGFFAESLILNLPTKLVDLARVNALVAGSFEAEPEAANA